MKHGLVGFLYLSAGPLALLLLLAGAVGCQGPEGTGDAVDAGAPDGSGEDGPPAWILASIEQPRGLLRNEPEATPGYVLFSQLTSDTTYLIDREGQVVHTWTRDRSGGALYLQDNGDLLRYGRIAEPPNFRAGGIMGYLERLSWDGEVLWEWKMGDEQRMLHHDMEPLPGGNILAVAWEQKSREEALAAGRRPDLIPEQGLWSEWILEIEPLPANDARIVWEWHVWDHLVQNVDPDAANYGDPADSPYRLDINADAEGPVIDEEELEQLKALGYIPDNATEEDILSDFLHLNAVDYHADLDQIALSMPEIGEVWIIDHSTTTEEARGSSGGRSGRGGDLLYRWGNPKSYGRGTKEDQELFYQHEVQWIPKGWARAGHLTMFNNGAGRLDGDWSSVVEIAPPVDEEGRYLLVDGREWGPEEPTWTYQAEDRHSFFAPFISGAHRLENGNTFVCSGPQGRFFEVTPGGEIVWEYRNPYHGDVPGWHPPDTEQVPYGSYRATKVPPDHPGLSGRTLRPLDPQPSEYELPPGPPGGPPDLP